MKSRRLNRKPRARNYFKQRKMWLVWLVVFLLAAVFIFCAFKVGEYAGGYLASRDVSGKLQAVNREAMATPRPTVETTVEAAPSNAPQETTPMPFGTVAPQYGGKAMLPVVQYPMNKYAHVTERFRKLQVQNKDIIGWLTIPQVVDEAVVQRDNEYYLTRDYLGKKNQNGAIFLDENCSLKTRPYALVLYGHNMKSGTMFGFMRHYDELSFYQAHPFVTFDTAYESGRYVIFAVGRVSTKAYDRDYLDLAKLSSSTILWREEAVETLRTHSVYTTTIDVEPTDQVLVMMTCVADDTERQVIAARRIRDGETEEMLNERIMRTRKKAY